MVGIQLMWCLALLSLLFVRVVTPILRLEPNKIDIRPPPTTTIIPSHGAYDDLSPGMIQTAKGVHATVQAKSKAMVEVALASAERQVLEHGTTTTTDSRGMMTTKMVSAVIMSTAVENNETKTVKAASGQAQRVSYHHSSPHNISQTQERATSVHNLHHDKEEMLFRLEISTILAAVTTVISVILLSTGLVYVR
jgi:hypothetical protein